MVLSVTFLRRVFSLLAILGYFQMSAVAAFAQTIEQRNDLSAIFTEHDVAGAFVLRHLESGNVWLVNPKRTNLRLIPASTFKIANSIIALELGVVDDENEVIPFGGKPQPFKGWEKDMSLRDAIRISNVPIFQELASRIGLANYSKWLEKLEYGNQKTGDDVTTFWLNGPLEISAFEQTIFIEKLATNKLQISQRTHHIVAEILMLETTDSYRLYGKTGWTITPDPDIGWFVGWVVTKRGTYAFALNMDVETRIDAKKRIPLTKTLLNKMGILEATK